MTDPTPSPRHAEHSSSAGTPSAEVLAWRLHWARSGVLLLLAVTVASAYLTRHCLAVANTRMQAELHFNNEQFGYLYSAFSLGYFLCQVPGGWLGQRLGTRVTLPLLCVLWSVLTLITGVVASLPALVSARCGFGLAQAGLIPNQAQVIKDWFPESRHGMASAVVVTAMSAGSFASLWLTARLINSFHWRTLFLGYALVGIAWSLFLFLVFRSHPAQMKWLHLTANPDALSASDSPAAPAASDRVLIWRIAAGVSFWALFTQMIFKAAGYNLLVTFFPAYLELAFGVSTERAGELTSWSLVAVVIGSLMGGRVVDKLQQRTGSKRISRVGVAALTLLFTATIMGATTYATTATQTAVMIAASSLIMGIASPCAWAASIDIGGKNTAVVMGFLNMGGALSGILISPLVGRLIDHLKQTQGHWNLVIQVHALFYLIAAACWLLVNLDGPPNRWRHVMLFDTHTNLMWYPDHYSDEFVEFAWEAKRAKMKLSPDVYFAGASTSTQNAFDSRPEQLLAATKEADKVIVFGIKAPFCGINADQELIAQFVKQHADRFIGWCSVDPNAADCVEQLEYYVTQLGLRGLKVSPIYQNWDPQDPKHLPLFKRAESLGIPVNIHQGTSFVRPGPLKYANPILLEDIAIACPDLRIVIAHMGHPWEDECVVLIRKHPNLYTNISALHYRPLRHYQAFMTAIEYGVEHKLIMGSDFPSATLAQVIAGQYKVNDILEGTKFPRISEEIIHNIIYENWKRFLPEYR